MLNQGQNELFEPVVIITEGCLKTLAPDEVPYCKIFTGKYLKRMTDSELEATTNEENSFPDSIPFGFGTPELMAALVIPLVVEVVKEIVIPFIKEQSQLTKEDMLVIELRIDKKGEKFNAKLKTNCKDVKLREKIVAEVIRSSKAIIPLLINHGLNKEQ